MKKRVEKWIVRIPISRHVDETISEVRKNVCEHEGPWALPDGWIFIGERRDDEEELTDYAK